MTVMTLTHSLPGQFPCDAHATSARQGTNSDSGQMISGSRCRSAAVGTTSPQANGDATPGAGSPAGGTLPDPTKSTPSPKSTASGPEQATDSGHLKIEAQYPAAAVGPLSEQDPQPLADRTPKSRALADPALAFAADVLDDLERVRNANANRLRIMTTLDADDDGVMRGFGLDESHPDVARLSAMVTALDGLTHDATLELQRKMRKHPLGPWAKAQRGIGEKQAARLLAAVGDPYWNTLHNRPRTVSELWAYCGLHTLPASQPRHDAHTTTAGGDTTSTGGDQPPTGTHFLAVAARRRKGVKSNWSTNAKTRAWLCIESCMKQIDATCKGDNGIGNHLDGCKCSPYRVVIDKRRTHAAASHPDWTPGHSLNDAMRIASKELLKDLWREARRIHEGV